MTKKKAFCENPVSMILFLKISLPRFIIGKVELNKRKTLVFFYEKRGSSMCSTEQTKF